MTIQRHKDHAVIQLPTGCSLLDERGRVFFGELRQLAEALHRSQEPQIKGVLVIQSTDADDREKSWFEDLRDRALLHDLAERIDDLRWVLSLVRNSPVPWVFASAFDCFGSYWELAAACHKRMWFAPLSRVGFPEILSGAYPPGGTLESLGKRVGGKVKERWKEAPIMTARNAAREGFIDFCSEARDFEAYALRFFKEGLESPGWMRVRDFERKGRRQAFDYMSDVKVRHEAVALLEEAWKEETQKTVKHPEAWDYCWQIVLDKKATRNSYERGRLISYIAAHHFLTPGYQAWLAGAVARKRFFQRYDVEKAVPKPVHVDVNFRSPPAEALQRLFDAGTQTVFLADDARALSGSLNSMFGKLEKLSSAVAVEEVWARYVNWFQGTCRDDEALVMRWGPGDKLLVRAGAARLELIRLEAADTSARLGSLEWTDPPQTLDADAETGLNLAKLVSNGIIRSKKIGAHALPLSAYVRSLLLEEVARSAPHADGDPTKVVDALKAHGWKFGGHEDSWDLFLKTRADDHPYDAQLTKPGGAPFSKPVWEARSWRELRSAAKKVAVAGTDGLPAWNAAMLSQHLALYLGFVAWHLAASGVLDGADVADYLCARALGFPAAYGTPLTFLRRRGRRRAEFHAAKQAWNGLSAEALWSGHANLQGTSP